MRVHILGVCGTFMGGIAALAKARGHEVSGADQNVYPPMSTQLAALGIALRQGYDDRSLDGFDCVVVGNALSRGKPVVEALLDSGMPYYSGPQWLADHVLRDRWVIAVSGTHGKTTTSSMLAWILECAGLDPGFLIGGIPRNFGVSARLGGSKYFVVEADEYDTAFFDKRAKFVHYRPRTLIVNNIEYDHADIFPDVDAVLWQFHQLLRTVPGNGRVIANGADQNVAKLLARGVWTPVETFSAADSAADWFGAYEPGSAESRFEARRRKAALGSVSWSLLGRHNLENALAALAAADHVGVPPDVALAGMRAQAGTQRIVAVMEPRSNTMRMGVHRDTLWRSFGDADRVFVLGAHDLGWDAAAEFAPLGAKASVSGHVDQLLERLLEELAAGDRVVLMSNGSFQGLPQKLEHALAARTNHER